MITEERLSFWIEKSYNVLITGRHGVGKSTIVIDAFNKAGLKWQYFSASTMDPWVDFIGVPKEKKDGANSYLELIRPKSFQEDEVEAIFLDEFNRCLTGDTKIALANGTNRPIKDLVGEDHFYVYAYDIEKNKIVIGRGHSARITESRASIVAVTLDNGAVIRCTSDHPFLLSSGEYCKAGELRKDTSLMPLYKSFSSPDDPNRSGYERVWFPKYNCWEYTHVLSDEYNIENGVYVSSDGGCRHHIDFNKYNNSPENIKRMNGRDHFVLHRETASAGGKAAHEKHSDLYGRTIGMKSSREKALANSIHRRQTDPKYKAKRGEISRNMYTSSMRTYRAAMTKEQWSNGQFNSFDRQKALKQTHISSTNRKLYSFLKDQELTEAKYNEAVLHFKGHGKGKYILSTQKILNYFGTFDDFKEAYETWKIVGANGNHRVVSVEKLTEREDVYDITVDKYCNFALSEGVFVHNSPKKVRNAVMELIQFKSINGKKFHKLKVIWAAINPEEKEDDKDDLEYDVEKLDPAQKDRFHVHVELPYKPDMSYFRAKYGDNGESAVKWWHTLPEPTKNMLSPRRLDYGLKTINDGGDIRDVFPKQANVGELQKLLTNSSVYKEMAQIYKNLDVAKAKAFICDENNWRLVADTIVKSKPTELLFWTRQLPKEILAESLSDNNATKKIGETLLSCATGTQEPWAMDICKEVYLAKTNPQALKNIKKAFTDRSLGKELVQWDNQQNRAVTTTNGLSVAALLSNACSGGVCRSSTIQRLHQLQMIYDSNLVSNCKSPADKELSVRTILDIIRGFQDSTLQNGLTGNYGLWSVELLHKKIPELIRDLCVPKSGFDLGRVIESDKKLKYQSEKLVRWLVRRPSLFKRSLNFLCEPVIEVEEDLPF